jgi:hypothetical protein
LISIQTLSYHLDLKGKSIESKLITIEIRTYPLDSKGQNLMNSVSGFAGHYLGVKAFSWI